MTLGRLRGSSLAGFSAASGPPKFKIILFSFVLVLTMAIDWIMVSPLSLIYLNVWPTMCRFHPWVFQPSHQTSSSLILTLTSFTFFSDTRLIELSVSQKTQVTDWSLKYQLFDMCTIQVGLRVLNWIGRLTSTWQTLFALAFIVAAGGLLIVVSSFLCLTSTLLHICLGLAPCFTRWDWRAWGPHPSLYYWPDPSFSQPHLCNHRL